MANSYWVIASSQGSGVKLGEVSGGLGDCSAGSLQQYGSTAIERLRSRESRSRLGAYVVRCRSGRVTGFTFPPTCPKSPFLIQGTQSTAEALIIARVLVLTLAYRSLPNP